MKVFLPQFFYSHGKYQPVSRISRIKTDFNNFNKQRQSISIRVPSDHEPRKKRPKWKRIGVIQSQQSKVFEESNSKNIYKKKERIKAGISSNKSEILGNLNKIYQNQKIYCMNLNEMIPLNKPSSVQEIGTHQNTRLSLIHSRKNSKSIKQNLLQFRKEHEEKSRGKFMYNSSKQMNNSFLTTNKISESLQQKRKKRLSRTTTQFDSQCQKKICVRDSKSAKPNPKKFFDRPWSPTKNQHEIDFIFS